MEDPRIEELQASRRRLVLAADAERRQLERELHDGAQQHLVGLAVELQLARKLVEADPAAAGALLDEIRGEVREALDSLRRLAERIYPPQLEAGGLHTALRSAAAAAGVRTHIEVTETTCPTEIAVTVYRCCLVALEHAGEGTSATITLREQGGALVLEILTDGSDPDLDSVRERVEALGGRLTVEREPAQGLRISGSFPSPAAR
jgi:signal transduction histidine kinase